MSFQLFLADKFLRFSMKRRMARNPDVMSLREVMNQMPPAKVPPHVQIAQLVLGGVPTERLATTKADPARAVLYIHGGGFVGGSPVTHRALTWRLSDQTASTIYAIDYRLAPEHPFPAGLDDCVSAYRALLETHSPANLSVGGDSAGGNLTLALCLKLKQLGLPQPSSAFCLSPVTELAGELESRRSNSRKDAMFDAAGFGTVPPRYCPNHDADDPLISVLRADVAGLPPTLLHCSRDEMLRDDSVLMAEKLKSAGVDVELDVWPKVFHVWHIAADTIPESRKAIEKVVRFVNGRWGREKLLAA